MSGQALWMWHKNPKAMIVDSNNRFLKEMRQRKSSNHLWSEWISRQKLSSDLVMITMYLSTKWKDWNYMIPMDPRSRSVVSDPRSIFSNPPACHVWISVLYLASGTIHAEKPPGGGGVPLVWIRLKTQEPILARIHDNFVLTHWDIFVHTNIVQILVCQMTEAWSHFQ